MPCLYSHGICVNPLSVAQGNQVTGEKSGYRSKSRERVHVHRSNLVTAKVLQHNVAEFFTVQLQKRSYSSFFFLLKVLLAQFTQIALELPSRASVQVFHTSEISTSAIQSKMNRILLVEKKLYYSPTSYEVFIHIVVPCLLPVADCKDQNIS